jgi:hypothetical protein
VFPLPRRWALVLLNKEAGMRTVERPSDRKELVREAGLPDTSLLSVLAGTMVAFGTIALLLAAVAGLGEAFDVDTTDLNGRNWDDAGLGAAIAFGVVLFVGYLFGGYVAGRMARRAGLRHGLLVFAFALVLAAAVAAVANAVGDTNAFVDDLRAQGVPTDADSWSGVGILAGVIALAGMLLGSILGGMRGERWHGRLVTRALDPDVLPRGEQERRDEAALAEGRALQEHRTERLQAVDEEEDRTRLDIRDHERFDERSRTVDVRDENDPSRMPSVEEERELRRP